jgi:hypothetical protein
LHPHGIEAARISIIDSPGVLIALGAVLFLVPG